MKVEGFAMTISQAFGLAVQHHRAGRLAEAEGLYRQILAAQPNHAEALHFLGVIAHQVGRNDVAVESIRRSIAINPNNHFAHSNLGDAYRNLGRLDESITAFRRALQLQPDSAEAHNNLGNALRERGQFDEAMAAFRHALRLRPDFPDFHYNLGVTLWERGQFDEAIASYRRALELKPDFPIAQNNLGVALQDRGQLDDAVAAYSRALELKADYPEAHNNLGNAFRERGHFDEATAAYRRAIQLAPDYPLYHYNLGVAFRDQWQLDNAVAAFRRALELKPNFTEALNNTGNALLDQGEVDEALTAYRRALAIDTSNAWAHSNVIYALQLHPSQNAGSISEEHRRWNRQFSDPLKPFLRPHENPAIARRLRVGYVSPDFRDHPVGRYVLPLLEQHDRERFEVFCYSGVTRPDSMTERFRALALGWRNTFGVPDAQLADMIREDGVDILVDLTMHTAENRLPVFARQPAPVQVSWLAYPGSTGLPGIEHRLTDAFMDPPGEKPAWSAEEPVRLPGCWCCYVPLGGSPEINALPALSQNGVTFGSLNNFAKIHEGVLALWARVLEAEPGSRLLMFCPEGRTRERVRAFFDGRRIAVDRVELVSYLPRQDYLNLYQRIDIGLDPFPCNGMTTTCDALWMGVPILTWPGEMPVSRAGLSLLSNIGLAELAASSEEDYVRIAVKLAGDLPRLADLRATLRPRMQSSPLTDAPRFARDVEAAYQKMWQRWRPSDSGLRKD